MEKQMYVNLSSRLTADTDKLLTQYLAQNPGIKKQNLIEEAVLEYLKKKGVMA